jgi:uncharacterized protein (DUF1330 family)
VSAYLIARIDVHDPEAYKAYMAKSKPSIEAYGGRILVRGGRTVMLEGEDEKVNRIVVVEFADMKTAEDWFASEQYQEARSLRTSVSDATFTLVEGA